MFGSRVIRCQACAAPLKVKRRVDVMQCQYCGATNAVGQAPQVPMRGHTTAPQTSGAGRWIVIGVLVLLLGGGFGALALQRDALFTEWYSTACLVDANGDDVLDLVGRSGMPGSTSQSLTVVDGTDGTVLWRGSSDFTHEDTVLCLGDDAFGVASPDPHLAVFDPRTRQMRWSMPLPDKLSAYGVDDGCLHVKAVDQQERTVSVADGKQQSCAAELVQVHRSAPGYFPRAPSVELEAEDVTYRLRAKEKGTALLTVSAHRGETMLWETRLRHAAADDALFFAHTPQTVLTYGVDPGNDDFGVVIGIDAETGRVRYEAAQSSHWSTNFPRVFAYNRRHLVMTWGFGLHGYDPTTGERVWNIGGR